MPILERMPQGEHSARLGKHPFGKAYRIRAPAGMLESSETSDDVSPTELADPLMKSLVSGIHIRTKHTVVEITQNISEDLCSPGFSNMIECNSWGDQDPKPPSQTQSLPSGLISIENRLSGQSLSHLFISFCQGFRDLLMKFAHRAQANIDPENRLGYFLTPSPSHTMQTAQMSKNCGESWTNTGSSLRRKLAPIISPTGTTNAHAVVFHDFRFGFGNVNNLMTQILAGRLIDAGMERSAAVVAHIRKERDDVVDLVHRYQVSIGPLVTRLTSAITFLGLLRRSWPQFGLGTVGRGRLRGIG
jgi:hypothetical protein